MMRMVFFTCGFDEHRCTQNPVAREAQWMAGVPHALRMFPQIESVIPEDTPPSTRVFYCPDCQLVALAPGKPS